MAQAGDYKLKKLWICYSDQTSKPILPEKTLRSMVSEMSIYQSIETPYLRVDVIINDPSEGFHDLLKGNEVLQVILETDYKFGGVGKVTLEFNLMLHRISDRIKSERQESYRLEFITPDALVNEFTRVNKVFKRKKISEIVSEILKQNLKTKEKVDIESTDRPITLVSPNWRPFDAISWTAQHATRSSKKQTGYLFYFSTREGYVYRSIDKLLETAVRIPELQTFKYVQKNLGVPGKTQLNPQLDDLVAIQSVKYNDVTKDLEQLRLGSYAGTVTGIDLLNLNTVTKERYKISDYFNKMSHAEKVKPFGKNSKIQIDQKYTRQYLVGLPTYLYSQEGQGSSPGALSGNITDQAMKELLYSTLRYVSMKHFVLSVLVPGNTTVSAGDCINLVLPTKDRKQKGQSLTLDPIYNGKYLVTSVVHRWTPDKLETILGLSRDTQWKEQFTT